MRPLLTLLTCVALLSGCAAVNKDLVAATARAQKAQQDGILTANDPLPSCLEYWQGALAPGGPASVLTPPYAGGLDLAVNVYILDTVVGPGPASDAMDRTCGPVANKILKNIGRRAPGL